MNKHWQSKWNPLLGTLPDPVLAEQLGVSLMSVKRHRWAGKIKAFGGTRVVQCSWCGRDIRRKKNTKDVSCKPCVGRGKLEAYRAWRKANVDKYRAYMRAWHARKKDQVKEWRTRWEASHPRNMARYRKKRNARAQAKRLATMEAALNRRVEAELRLERERVGGWDHYGWARNVE